MGQLQESRQNSIQNTVLISVAVNFDQFQFSLFFNFFRKQVMTLNIHHITIASKWEESCKGE